MKKNKMRVKNYSENFLRIAPFFKNYFFYLILFVLFIIAIVLTILFIQKKQQSVEAKIEWILPKKFSLKMEVEKLEQTTSTIRTDLELLIKRMNAIEGTTHQQNQTLQTLQVPDKLIALELIHGVLEGKLPLEALRVFLQKRPEPWKSNLLTSLAPLGEIKDYKELILLLVVPAPPPPSLVSLWQRIKNKIKSLISVRKIDENGNYKASFLKDVHVSLQAHNIQIALESFAKLTPEEQAPLATWVKLARDRLELEMQEKKLLNEIAME